MALGGRAIPHPGWEEPPTPTTAPQTWRHELGPHAETEPVGDQVLLPGCSSQRQVVWTTPREPALHPAPRALRTGHCRNCGARQSPRVSPQAAGYGRPFRPIPASPGVICPVNARGLIIGPKVGFVQDERVELSLPPRGVVHLSDVALRDDKLPVAEMGATGAEHWRGLRPARASGRTAHLLFASFPRQAKLGACLSPAPSPLFSCRDPGQRRPVDSQGRTGHTLRAPPHLCPEQRPHRPVIKARTSSDSPGCNRKEDTGPA